MGLKLGRLSHFSSPTRKTKTLIGILPVLQSFLGPERAVWGASVG